ncbi:MAG: hypothetical protein FJW69_05790 [Actinobacteria bacterium]|nr:hypothetical protein [Actinomycetota bacterium]MBM3712124.1 hypothetical protein [Actinomycetota bacterium]
MTHRERIRNAINHKALDRIPIDFGGTNLTSISMIAYSKLKKLLGINKKLPMMYDFLQQIAVVEEEIINRFKVDVINPAKPFLQSSIKWQEFTIPYDGTKCLIPEYIQDMVNIRMDNNQTILISDKDGTVLGIMPKTSVHFRQTYWPYGNIKELPDNFNANDINKTIWAVPFPPHNYDITNEENLKLIFEKIKNLHQTTDYAILYMIGGSVFLLPSSLRKFDDFLCDIYKNKKNVKKLLNYIVEKNLILIEKIINTIGGYIEALIFYDDLGYQKKSFIPKDIYKEIFKPAHKTMWDYIHENSNCKIFLHADGSIYELLPELIDAGIDILNPVQTSASDMEPEKLKKEFGKYITFWGGGCEPETLAFKSRKDIKEEVKKRIEVLGKDGGFIFAPILNITAEVPPENIVMMFETASNY